MPGQRSVELASRNNKTTDTGWVLAWLPRVRLAVGRRRRRELIAKHEMNAPGREGKQDDSHHGRYHHVQAKVIQTRIARITDGRVVSHQIGQNQGGTIPRHEMKHLIAQKVRPLVQSLDIPKHGRIQSHAGCHNQKD